MNPNRNEYIEALTRWIKAKTQYGGLDHGPEPSAKNYGFLTELEIWEASKIATQLKREMSRTV